MNGKSLLSSFINTTIERWPMVLDSILSHLSISLMSLAIAVLIGVPLGIFITRHRKFASVIIKIASVFQTIPSVALLGFMIPFFGIGRKPAVIALTIYALLPILQNTYTG
ncbi:MAG: ABC transporter permease, partial [Tissierellia bacterium]|nr:ABC transporter permease [Tissierellia bacterium]